MKTFFNLSRKKSAGLLTASAGLFTTAYVLQQRHVEIKKETMAKLELTKQKKCFDQMATLAKPLGNMITLIAENFSFDQPVALHHDITCTYDIGYSEAEGDGYLLFAYDISRTYVDVPVEIAIKHIEAESKACGHNLHQRGALDILIIGCRRDEEQLVPYGSLPRYNSYNRPVENAIAKLREVITIVEQEDAVSQINQSNSNP
ncbi:MAG: hypothetical protein ACHP65_10090 [Legionellales bacterium]